MANFQFSQFYFHEWVCQNGQLFLEGLNFTIDQYPWNSQKLRTSKKQLYGTYSNFCCHTTHYIAITNNKSCGSACVAHESIANIQ